MRVRVSLKNLNISRFDEILLYYGLQRKEIDIIEGELDIPEKGFILITGISGSGKSFVLREIAKKLNVEVLKFNDFQYNSSTLLKDYINDLKLLSQAGFSDIPVLFTEVEKLSDGQKYRLFLLEKILSNDVLIIDEFCNQLDEFYTISIMKMMKKYAKEKLIIAATSRPFGLEYFPPDKVYRCECGRIYEEKIMQRNILDDIKIEPANISDWQYFARYHYRNSTPGIFNKALKAVYRNHMVGIVVAGQPYLNISVRNRLFPKYKNNGRLVNRDIFMIHRIVVSPEMRNLGISRLLIKEIEKVYKGKKMVELVTSLNDVIPFAEKAGFTFGGVLPPNPIRKKCQQLGFDFHRYLDDEYVREFVSKHFDELRSAVIDSYRRGLRIKNQNLTIDRVTRDVQRMCNIITKYYYKML